MKSTLFAVTTAALCAGSASGNLIITGVFDGGLPGGEPKVVELYATSAIADRSISMPSIDSFTSSGSLMNTEMPSL